MDVSMPGPFDMGKRVEIMQNRDPSVNQNPIVHAVYNIFNKAAVRFRSREIRDESEPDAESVEDAVFVGEYINEGIQASRVDTDYDPFKKLTNSYFNLPRSTLNRIYTVGLFLATAWSYVHTVIYLVTGVILANLPGAVLADYFFNNFDQKKLSPFTPVWSEIGDHPFEGFFVYFYIYCFVMVVLHLFVVVICGCAVCVSTGHRRDLGSILVVICLSFGIFNFLCIIFRDWYIVVIFTVNNKMMLNMINLHYNILATDRFSNAFNMLMILGKCCGITGPNDFRHMNVSVHPDFNPYEGTRFKYINKLPHWPAEEMYIIFKVPAACCEPVNYADDPLEGMKLIKECVAGRGNYYSVGCREMYIDLFNEYVMPIKSVSDGGTAVLMTMVAVLTGMNLCEIHQSNEHPVLDDDVKQDDDDDESDDNRFHAASP